MTTIQESALYYACTVTALSSYLMQLKFICHGFIVMQVKWINNNVNKCDKWFSQDVSLFWHQADIFWGIPIFSFAVI